MNRSHFLAIVLSVMFLLTQPHDAHGWIIPIGLVEPGFPSEWDSSTYGYIGKYDYGGVIVTGGSELYSGLVYLGQNRDGTGEVLVTDAGSTWTNTTYLQIGYAGTGMLTVMNGGAVTSGQGVVANLSGSTGSVTIDGAGSIWTNTNSLVVGNAGSATLSVTNGGTVDSGPLGIIGYTSAGQVTLSGAGSRWTGIGTLHVGYSGNGTLNVTEGTTVSCGAAHIGYSSTGTGQATVRGPGSQWVGSGDLSVGSSGNGTLTIANGGTATVAETTWVARSASASGTIRFGDGGGLLSTRTLCASLASLAGTGVINTCGVVSDLNLTFDSPSMLTQVLALNSDPDQNITLNLDLSGSANGALGAGWKGSGSLAVRGGTTVTSTCGYLGYHSASNGAATVSGANSAWINSSELYIGYYGTGSLSITDGGTVTNTSACLGSNSNSAGTATVSGVGSLWSNTASLIIGSAGNGTLTVVAGGSLVSHGASVATSDSSVGQVTVMGAGSTWTNNGGMTIGDRGNGTLAVSAGAHVTSSGNCHIGDGYNGAGAITVSGAGSTWTGDGTLFVGEYNSGTMAVLNGATVTNRNTTYLGYYPSASGTVTVSGSGSTWFNDSSLHIGYRGSGTVELANGAAVSVGIATYVGAEAGSAGRIVFGAGRGTFSTDSLLASPNQLSGAGTINSHGLVSDMAIVFNSMASLTQTVTLNSQLGQNVTLNLDLAAPPTGNRLLGAGWQGDGSLSIRAGILVSSDTGLLGYHVGSVGAASVQGPGSTWANSGTLTVGRSGNATLAVTGGGNVSNTTGYIAYDSGSAATATIAGVGSTWINTGDLYVGYDGSGTLEIADGGSVTVGAATRVAYSTGASGTIRFGNGSLTTPSLWATPSQLTGSGTIHTRAIVGLLSDLDIVLDAASGLQPTTALESRPDQHIAINLDLRNSAASAVIVGYHEEGSLTIRDGIVVSSAAGRIGDQPGSAGTVTISDGSKWINADTLYVGSSGNAVLAVASGGKVSNRTGYVATSSDSVASATIIGTGSSWTNTANLYVGNGGVATLHVADGGLVTASQASVSSRSTLAISVGGGSRLTVNAGAGTFTNNGAVRLMAGAGPATGALYSPIAARTWSGAGVYQALGGIWSPALHTFTVSAVEQGTSGNPVSITLNTKQRVLVDDVTTGWSLGASFLAKSGGTPLDFTATTIGGSTLTALQSLLGYGESVFGAWLLAAGDAYVPGDPAYLSFDIGASHSRDDLRVWHYYGTWEEYTAWDLAYGGTYASFTVTGLGGYAVTGIATLPAIPGDADGDNRVDQTDATVLAAHWGTSVAGGPIDGDFNRDGVVNAADASILAANWSGAAEADPARPSVPEPAAWTLLLTCVLAGFFSRRRAFVTDARGTSFPASR